MNFSCKCCNYYTNLKSNLAKHLQTQKHFILQKSLKSQEKVNIESTNSHEKVIISCKYCSKLFKHKQSMYHHIKYSCTKNKDEDLKELVRLLNNQNKQLVIKVDNQDKQIENQSKQIEKLMGKLEINNSFNTTVNIQNITRLSYTETDTSHLTDTDYKTCLKKRNGCVVKMIEKVHFNPKKPENMNVYISSMKNKYVMMYEDGNWKLINKKDAIEKIYDDKEDLIMYYMNNNNPPELKADFKRYLHLKEDETADKNQKSLYEEVKLMLYNNKHIVLKPHIQTSEAIKDK